MPIQDIAGYGALIFSVLIGIAVVVSLDKRVYEAKLESLVWALFFTGIAGSIVFPSIATTYWICLDLRGKITVASIDIIGVVAIVILICYFVKLLRNKAFRERDMKKYLPDDSALDQKSTNPGQPPHKIPPKI
jgi:hypothetical protein